MVGRVLARNGIAGALAECLILLACGSEEQTSAQAAKQREEPPSTTEEAQPSIDVDQLRALGYAAYAEPDSESASAVVLHEESSLPGFNLCVSRDLRKAELFDDQGKVVRVWQQGKEGHWARGLLVPDGHFMVIGSDKAPREGELINDDGRFVMKMTFDGEPVWKRSILSHHDLIPAPDGGYLVLTFNFRRIPSIHPSIDIRDDQITHLSNDGEIISETSLYDLLTAEGSTFSFQPVQPTQREQETFIDLFHANALHWIPDSLRKSTQPFSPGSLVVTIRHQDTIAIVDWDRKEATWTWGQGIISGPHDAQILPSGQLLLFDNGLSRGWSRVIEVDPKTRKLSWQYHAPRRRSFFSPSRGGAQRLSNGHTLITDSDSGSAFEITPRGRQVWRYRNPHQNPNGGRATMNRVQRYDPEWVEELLRKN
jgi:hypothetical protein